ncbi:unnamed protein product [Cylicocyclus nassatus]|uniref:Saposin B-type domain-containing protein n=1 Tax=Cylicocyclus nassatus TaxID=53992 RepID=A0AA36DTG0_CYLNA|nr:unnamed protein product [Cylicocyclus nassatus]
MRFILLFALVLCTVLGRVKRVADDVDDKPPWCEICIDLAEKLKETLKWGDNLNEVAHKFCSEKMPTSLIEECHINVDKYWVKVMESIEETPTSPVQVWSNRNMRTALVVAVILSAITMAVSYRKKPLCEMCEGLIEKVDEVLEKGGDIEQAVDEFCREDVPSFLVDYCEKIIAKNLKEIIEKLKDHESPEKICTDIYLCAA